MLFDFEAFINELREHPEKCRIIERYEEFVGPIEADIRQNVFYINYLSRFKTIGYTVPEELENDFDWALLLQLVAASFSSTYRFILNEQNIPELEITVRSGDTEATKTLSELWSFQVLRLYEVYLEEQINLEALRHEDEKEKKEIDLERQLRLEQFIFCSKQTEAQRMIEAFCGVG